MAMHQTSARFGRRSDWRAGLRRRVGWSLVLKLVALVVLWVLFFSPAHRTPVDAASVGARLAFGAPSAPVTDPNQGAHHD